MESILNSIKKLLGVAPEYEQYDSDIIMHINSVLMTLTQLGVGPEDGYYITGNTEVWTELVAEAGTIEAVKSYVYLKVRLLFDPPSSGTLVESINRQASELEWRIRERAEELKNADE